MIKCTKLTKFYKNVRALYDLNLEIEKGVIYGFIGPNGAGKTTSIRILCGLLQPTSGTAEVGGVDVTRHPEKVKRMIGYLPDFFGVYDEMSVWEYLDFFGAAYRLKKKERGSRIEQVLELAGATEMRDYQVNSLSRGMKQKVGIAKTLMHDPDVLFLDEPASGLDPRARIEIRVLISRLKQLGKTIMLSSHILPELADICDQIGIIEKGVLLVSGEVSTIMKQIRMHRLIEIEVGDNPQRARDIVKSNFDVSNSEVMENMVRVEFSGKDDDIPRMLKLLVESNANVIWFRESTGDLEELFLTVTALAANERQRAEKEAAGEKEA